MQDAHDTTDIQQQNLREWNTRLRPFRDEKKMLWEVGITGRYGFAALYPLLR